MIFLNKDQFLKLLIQLFSEYDDMLILHYDTLKELVVLLKNAGMEGQFLSNLKMYGDAAIGGRGAPMEHLSGEAPLCSMRFLFATTNFRIIFAYQNEHIYLLSTFHERAGKKKTSYSAHIPIARQRLEELLKER